MTFIVLVLTSELILLQLDPYPEQVQGASAFDVGKLMLLQLETFSLLTLSVYRAPVSLMPALGNETEATDHGFGFIFESFFGQRLDCLLQNVDRTGLFKSPGFGLKGLQFLSCAWCELVMTLVVVVVIIFKPFIKQPELLSTWPCFANPDIAIIDDCLHACVSHLHQAGWENTR